MSHLNLIKQIKNSNDSEYAIIFEDDFDIVVPNFVEEVQHIIENVENMKIDFDLILLGNLNDNKGEQVTENVYKINENESLWGTHGYLVKISNIDKIIDKIKFIDMAIDNKYETLGKNEELNIFVVNPTIVNQQVDTLPSNINELNIETFLPNYTFTQMKI
jgi:GR25 family glycosyltransferase involved in LPS biosynthesis